MALISETSNFDADGLPAPVIGVAADIGQHDSGIHYHKKGQLLYAPQGCITLTLEDALCILPPTKAVWIPPYTKHRAQMTNVVAYRSLYFDSHIYTCPEDIEIIEVNELLKALINKMSFWEWDIASEQTTNTANLFWEEFYCANKHSFILPLPTDRRFKRFCEQVRSDSFLAPGLSTLAASVGASTKTITRLFKAETGMTYQDWRQQWRLFKAIELLSENRQVGDVAELLEFSSNSAFITFFKQQTGQTPLAFTKLRA